MDQNTINAIVIVAVFAIVVIWIFRLPEKGVEKKVLKDLETEKEKSTMKSTIRTEAKTEPENTKGEKNGFSGKLTGDSEDAVVLFTNNCRFKGWVCPRCHTENTNNNRCGVCGLKKGEGY